MNIRNTIEFWQAFFLNKDFVNREKEHIFLKKGFASFLLGVRRSGKTVLAYQLAKKTNKKIFYINFEDPFFTINNEVSVLDTLIEEFTIIYKYQPEIIILDEIQYIQNWERWCRKHIDNKQFQLIITGSSASLLRSDKATSLTGRTIENFVYPLTFKEVLLFNNKINLAKNIINALFEEYLIYGGFPEVILEKNNQIRRGLLQGYFHDILYRDIILRYKIRNPNILIVVSNYLFKHISCLTSYTKIKDAFSTSTDTIKDYFEYLSEVFLFFKVHRYHPNFKQQIRDPIKVYCVDSGIRNAHIGTDSIDLGRLVENLVYLRLREKYNHIYYFKEKYEVDFVVLEMSDVKKVIQVCYSNMENIATKDREQRALIEALDFFGIKKGIIITKDYWKEETVDGKIIEYIPIIKWLAQN